MRAASTRDAARVRPRVVINDPELSASQPPAELAASAGNALGHAVEGAATTMASPVPTLAAREAARRLVLGLPADGEPDRDELALGALLSGYAIDASWYGLHHVMSQTLVREAGAGHGPANAALLPVTSAALRERNPAALAALDDAAGEPVESVAARFAALAGVARLRDTGVDEGRARGMRRGCRGAPRAGADAAGAGRRRAARALPRAPGERARRLRRKRGGRVLEPVVAPEQLVADRDRRHAGDAARDRLLGRLAQARP